MIVLPARPTYDHALAEWILEQRAAKGHDRTFYNSREWRLVRALVLVAHHFESQWELGLTPSRYERATVVHHVMHVSDHPGWALSEYAIDERGEVVRNLVPLSHRGHDEAHGRFGPGQRRRVPPLTEERW